MKVDGSLAPRPYAYADRRSLSRAWFDALYGTKAAPVRAADATLCARNAVECVAEARHRSGHGASATAAVPAAPRTSPWASASPLPARGADHTPAVITRERMRNAAAPHEPHSGDAESGRFDLAFTTHDGAPVRFLVAGRGERLEVVAVTHASHAARVTDALEAAQSALAARGIPVSLRLVKMRNAT